MIRIREISPDDADAMVKLMQQLDRETEFLLFEPGERPLDPGEWKEKMRDLRSPDYGTFFVAEYVRGDLDQDVADEYVPDAAEEGGPVLAGYLEVRRLPWQKVRHRIYLVIGIRKDFSGMGVGTRLMQEVENWAGRNGIRRIYLTVIAENLAAVQLYRKMGYETEGWHPASMRLHDRYVDELTMGKWL